MRAILLLAVLSLGCPTKPAEDTTPKPRKCKTSDDCEKGWICLANECADMRSKAIYTEPSTAVTPDKVKREVEQKLRQQERKMDNLPTQ